MQTNGSALIDFLRMHMSTHKWTTRQFADQTGVSPQVAYRWLAPDARYRIIPSPASCIKIALVFGVDPDVVLELAGHRMAHGLTTEPTAIRQMACAQLHGWLDAVGERNERSFLELLIAYGSSTVATIRQITAAVSHEANGAVSASVSETHAPRAKHRSRQEPPLTPSQHASASPPRSIGRQRLASSAA